MLPLDLALLDNRSIGGLVIDGLAIDAVAIDAY